MSSQLFIAQHHPAPDPRQHRRNIIGYFSSLAEAQKALEECHEAGAWQGIRSVRTNETWWRETSPEWQGPFRSRAS